MNLDKIFNIASMIVVLAVVTTIVARPNSVRVIRAFMNGMANLIGRAMGEQLDRKS